MESNELYSETLMNVIMDVIDDIIVIHDSDHTIVWMNRAGEKAFGKCVDDVIGTKCYHLFDSTVPCSDCIATVTTIGGPVNNSVKRRVIPATGTVCDCAAVPLFKNGKLELVVQHLRPVCGCSDRPA